MPTSSYRLQCLHHGEVLGKSAVLCIAAKGSNMSVGSTISGTLLQYNNSFIADNLHCISTIHVYCFEWIRNDTERNPLQLDELLVKSHATDLFSYASSYNLSNAYKMLAEK